MLTLKACSSEQTPAGDAYNGLANSRFHTLLFGINRLRSGELPHCWAKNRCLGAFVQLLCIQNFNGLSCRCTATTGANDGVSCGYAISAREWSSLNTSAWNFFKKANPSSPQQLPPR